VDKHRRALRRKAVKMGGEIMITANGSLTAVKVSRNGGVPSSPRFSTAEWRIKPGPIDV
jgi:hypothetical protein